jgi:hypothetical protein
MRTVILGLSLILSLALALGAGCKKKDDAKKKKIDACENAQKEAASKWNAVADQWQKANAAWKDPKLINKVKEALDKKVKDQSNKYDEAKAKVETKRFEEYVKFKLEHTAKAEKACRAAAKATTAEFKKANKAARRAFTASMDPSISRDRKASWFTEPVVVKADEVNRKAITLATDARNASKEAAGKCQ